MAIFQCGAPKSGNFWLYKIIQQILLQAGKDNSSFIQKQEIFELAKKWELNFPEQASIDVLDITDQQCSYRISSIFRMPIENLHRYVSQTSQIWSHSPICKRSAEVFEAIPKKVYIIRDPRDRAVSAARYYCSDYMQKYFPQEITDPDDFLEKKFGEMMENWLWHVFDHLRLSSRHNIHICYYEGFVLDFQNELDKLLAYLGIDFPEEKKIKLEKSVQFEKLKKTNPKHLHKGEVGRWRNILSKEQAAEAEEIAGALFSYLGYDAIQPLMFKRKFDGEELKALKQELLF